MLSWLILQSFCAIIWALINSSHVTVESKQVKQPLNWLENGVTQEKAFQQIKQVLLWLTTTSGAGPSLLQVLIVTQQEETISDLTPLDSI